MSDQITISKTLSLRDCGMNENWLQSKIETDPSILGLGDLEVVHREKKQSSGGRLDFLLEDSADGSMYEVELMLGETDASHIIRTIEYWDLERRRWPKRSHTAVLVAENINRRFFNVIQLLSLTIPIVAIRANIVEADGKRILNFTTVLHAYEEPEQEGRAPTQTVGENYWQEKASWTLAHAKALEEVLSRVIGKMDICLGKDGIRLLFAKEPYFKFVKRNNDSTAFYTWLKNAEMPVAKSILDKAGIACDVKPWSSTWQTLRFTIDQESIRARAEVFRKIAELVKQSWQK
jgi:hypothetical protein